MPRPAAPQAGGLFLQSTWPHAKLIFLLCTYIKQSKSLNEHSHMRPALLAASQTKLSDLDRRARASEVSHACLLCRARLTRILAERLLRILYFTHSRKPTTPGMDTYCFPRTFNAHGTFNCTRVNTRHPKNREDR